MARPTPSAHDRSSGTKRVEIRMTKRAPFRIRLINMLTAVALVAAEVAGIPSAATAADAAPAVARPDQGSNTVVGIGLVVGLPGTGDSAVDDALVESSIVGVLRRAGLDIWRGEILPGRVAKVVISAELPANPAEGTRFSVSVTAIGDAASLAGGTLLATPLRDPNGKVYAVGQGRIEVGKQVATAAGQPLPSEFDGRAGTLVAGAVVAYKHFNELASE